MRVQLVVDNPERWPFNIANVDVVSARAYLTDAAFARGPHRRVFNLCRSYKYQSTGYYVSLLAEARGHRPIPSVSTIQELKSSAHVRGATEDLDDLVAKTLHGSTEAYARFHIFFARTREKKFERLGKQLFSLFPSPMLRAEFERTAQGWRLDSLGVLAASDIREDERPFVVEAARDFFEGKTQRPRRRSQPRYQLAVLLDPGEKHPPSDERALEKFEDAAGAAGVAVERIDRDEIGRLAEFDALFIRATTAVNHFTYRFAQRAVSEGLVVVDDPLSILKCSNKVFLAELMERHKVPTPQTIIVHRDNFRELPAQLGFPVILKQPDSSFSQGVSKAENLREYLAQVEALFQKSELVIAQQFLPTPFDWRVGVLDGKPLYACKYHMVRKHWQIYQRSATGRTKDGQSETLPVEIAPRQIVRAAVKAAKLIGDGFYGVDVKEIDGKPFLIEVNDNPSIESGVEDDVLRDALYERLVDFFVRRVDQARSGLA